MSEPTNGNVLRYRVERLEGDVDDMKAIVELVPVIKERQDAVIDNQKSIRNALYSAAGGLLAVAAAVVFVP